MARLSPARTFVSFALGFGITASALAVAPAPTPNPSSFEARLAVAKTVRVMTSLLGVTPGMSLKSARLKLDKLADPATPPKQEGDEDDEKGEKHRGEEKHAREARDEKRAKTADPAPVEKDEKSIGSKKGDRGEEDENGIKVLWKLAPGTDYQWVFIEAEDNGKIDTIFGYPWPDKPIPFEQIGDVAKAPVHSADEVAWDSVKPKAHYRIAGTGANEHAVMISITLMTVRTNGVHSIGGN